MMISGVMMRDMHVPLDAVNAWVTFGVGVAILFPIDQERTRAYYGYRMRDGKRLHLTGSKRVPEFLRLSLATDADGTSFARGLPCMSPNSAKKNSVPSADARSRSSV